MDVIPDANAEDLPAEQNLRAGDDAGPPQKDGLDSAAAAVPATLSRKEYWAEVFMYAIWTFNWLMLAVIYYRIVSFAVSFR